MSSGERPSIARLSLTKLIAVVIGASPCAGAVRNVVQLDTEPTTPRVWSQVISKFGTRLRMSPTSAACGALICSEKPLLYSTRASYSAAHAVPAASRPTMAVATPTERDLMERENIGSLLLDGRTARFYV